MNLTMLAATWRLDRAPPFFFRRGRSAPPFLSYAGGVGSVFVIAAVGRPKRTVSPLPHLVQSGLDVPGLVRRVVFLLTILDTAIIGECLIAGDGGTFLMGCAICGAASRLSLREF